MSSERLINLKIDVRKKSTFMLDVRELSEWQAGHLKHAIFWPLSQIMKKETCATPLLKSNKLYIYCRSGVRSFTAKSLLEKMGFTNVIALKEGMKELVENGFEYESATKV